METNRMLGADLALENDESQEVLGGGQVRASVDGAGSATVTGTGASAEASGMRAELDASGSSVGAKVGGSGTSAQAGAKKPRMRRPRQKTKKFS